MNLFPVYEEVDSDRIRKIGKIKSIAFIFTFLLSICLTAAFYSTSKVSITAELEDPQYNDYTQLLAENDIVECDCQQVSSPLSDFVTYDLPPDPFCEDAHYRLNTICRGTYALQCQGSSLDKFFGGLSELCNVSLGTLDYQLTGLSQQLLVSASLLSEAALSERVESEGANAYLTAQAISDGSSSLLRTLFDLDRPELNSLRDVPDITVETSDLSDIRVVWENAVSGNLISNLFGDCICTDEWSCEIQVDMSSDVGGFGRRVCSVYQTVMNNPIKVWSSEAFYKQGLGFIVDDPAFFQFLGITPEIFYSSDPTWGVLIANDSNYFEEQFQIAYREGMSTELSVTLDHEAYFGKCNPSKCEYTSTRARSAIEIIAVLAGLIGGFKVGIDALIRCCFSSAESKALNEYQEEKRETMDAIRKSTIEPIAEKPNKNQVVEEKPNDFTYGN